MNIIKKSLVGLILTSLSTFALAVPVGGSTSKFKVTVNGSVVTTTCDVVATAKTVALPKVSTAALHATNLAGTGTFEVPVTGCDAEHLKLTIEATKLKGKFMDNELTTAAASAGALLNVAFKNVAKTSAASAIAGMTYTPFTDLSTATGKVKTVYAGSPTVAAGAPPLTADQEARGKIYMQVGFVKDPDTAVTAKAGTFRTTFTVKVDYN